MKRHIAVLLVLGMLPWAGLNAQQTTTLRVSATVVEYCEVSAPDLALGNYTAQSGAPLQPPLVLSATCTPNMTYYVGVGKRMSPGTTISQPIIMSGAQASSSQSYSGAARSTIAGNAIGANTVTGVGTGEEVDHAIFGGAPATQVIPAGNYADTVTIRVYY